MDSELPKIPLFSRGEATTHHPAGAVIFDIGSPSDCMYAIQQGGVEVRVKGEPIERLQAGHVFGELGLIDDQPRSAQVIATTDCELVRIDRKRFQFLIQQTPSFALQIMAVLAHRLRRGAPRA
jgi:CRP/FNR family transcriptional regulator, cyclic AMP receptor protein